MKLLYNQIIHVLNNKIKNVNFDFAIQNSKISQILLKTVNFALEFAILMHNMIASNSIPFNIQESHENPFFFRCIDLHPKISDGCRSTLFIAFFFYFLLYFIRFRIYL